MFGYMGAVVIPEAEPAPVPSAAPPAAAPQPSQPLLGSLAASSAMVRDAAAAAAREMYGDAPAAV
jgi:hypothetical protein